MEPERRQTHWEAVYTAKAEQEVSWFQASPTPSLEAIARTGAGPDSALIDIGGGASRLVDHLLAQGFVDVSVLDLSAAALDAAKARLAAQAVKVDWIVADVTTWQPSRTYDVWHDRAAFHFLTDANDRAAYVAVLARALKIGGHAIIATFALDGPERCSGLPVVRYDAASLGQVLRGQVLHGQALHGQALGPALRLIHSSRHDHATPWDSRQSFQFSVFQREG